MHAHAEFEKSADHLDASYVAVVNEVVTLHVANHYLKEENKDW